MQIYIPVTDFANLPTRKTWRELRAAFPQVHSRTVNLKGTFRDTKNDLRQAGVVLLTDNDPEPDEQAIRDFAVGHDGTVDPPRFGFPIPLVDDAAALPVMPPLGRNQAYLVGVVSPPGLYGYARGQWVKLT